MNSLIFFTSVASASLAMPGDGPYYRLRRERTLYVYDSSAHEAIEQVMAYMQAVRKGYDSSFAWKLDEEQDLILASGLQQVGNAYATFSPNLKSFWFPSGNGMLDEMAVSSWFLTLTTHETAHLYQLNAKGEFNAGLKRIVGNAVTIFPFIWPIFVHPNMVTPTFLVEGNAVFNESRANMGGRLHSGEARALVLAQIQAGDINPTRLINNEWRFPYGEQAYLQGAYFQAHLAAKYGVDQTNQFFVAQGNHYFWPLILNKTFRDHFGASYPQEIREYLRELEGLATKQKYTPGPALSEAQYIGPLNQDATRIFYVQSDGIYLPELMVFDKQTQRLVSRSIDLDVGKVFWLDGRPMVATTKQHDLHHIEYSLYAENDEFVPAYRSQIVNDMRGGKVVSLDATNSWLEPHVLLNGELYDVGHSRPILDDAGNVYFFRQNGIERVLYKNRQPVFKFDGYYAKPVEVGSDGSFYFIGNTDYGSTLYQYKDNEIYRVLSSDRIVDARMVTENQFLVTEVNSRGHSVKVASAEHKPATPATYSYGFPSYNLTPDKVGDPEQTKADERSYNAAAEMRYSSMDLVTTYDRYSGFAGLIGTHFADPLEYQTVDLMYSGSQFRDQNIFAQYTFTKYLPQIFARYIYQSEFWRQRDNGARRAFNQEGALGVYLPVWRWRHWDANIGVAAIYRREDQHVDPSEPTTFGKTRMEETYGTQSDAGLHYQEDSSPSLSMFPIRLFDLNFKNRLEALPDTLRKRYNTSLVQSRFQQGLPIQFYMTFAGSVAWAENHDVLVDYNPMPLSEDIRVSRLTSHEEFKAKTASSARFELTKVFDLPLYSPRIPVGFDRISPLVLAQGVFLDRDNAVDHYAANIFEWGYGVDLQLLLVHLAHAKLRLIEAFDTRTPVHREKQAVLSVNLNF